MVSVVDNVFVVFLSVDSNQFACVYVFVCVCHFATVSKCVAVVCGVLVNTCFVCIVCQSQLVNVFCCCS